MNETCSIKDCKGGEDHKHLYEIFVAMGEMGVQSQPSKENIKKAIEYINKNGRRKTR